MWNLFIDIRSSMAGRNAIRDPDGGARLYDKLFRGNNLPAMNAEHYVPQWTAQEVTALSRILNDGFQLFLSVLPIRN